MKTFIRRHRKLWLTLVLLLTGAVLVWAASELAGQAYRLAQDSGSNAGGLEIVSLRSVITPATSVASVTSDQFQSSIESSHARYRRLTRQALTEQDRYGKVSEDTQNQILASASEFRDLCDDYAHSLSAARLDTRAELVRAIGVSRTKSARLVAGKTSARYIRFMNNAQKRIKNARHKYALKAVKGRELNATEQAHLAAVILPQAKQLVESSEKIARRADALYFEVQMQVLPGGQYSSYGVPGKNEDKLGLPDDEFRLLKQTEALSRTGWDVVAYSQALVNDIVGLAGGHL